jgi:PAS domain S-box-containing protein
MQQFRFYFMGAQRMEQTRSQIAAIIAASSDAIISTGADLAIQSWNASAQRLFGYSEAEAIGRSIIKLIIPEGYEVECSAIHAAAISNKTAVLKETVRRHKDGRLFPVETSVSPMFDGAGNVTGLSIIIRDISERRRRAERQALLLEVTSDLIRATEPSELSRVTFQHIGPAFRADICLNFRLDPGGQHLELEFESGILPELSAATQSLELGQAYCGMAAASRQPVVADKERIACDPNGSWARALGATVFACYPLLASEGRLLGTFAIASRTRESFTDDEVAWLGTVINFLAQAWERLEAEQGLRASEERLRIALDAAQLGWWHFDPSRGGVTLGDTRSKEIFGRSAEVSAAPLSCKEFFKKHLDPLDAGKVRAALKAALDPVEPKPYATEYRVRRRGGKIRWVEAHGLAHFEGTGRERRAVNMVGTIQDITERKEREEKEHLLMHEINHRTGNMLSVVHTIAQQTVARNPEDFIERFSERLQALSANQDLLVRNEWTGVEIEDLVRAQLAHFVDLIGPRITVQGPKLHLNPASVQAIGLALHELATNAGKYGALSKDRGRVDICWGCDDDTLTISWTERDGPASPPKLRGFGTLVMEAMAERSVGGEVELHYAPSGVTWRLTCPAGNAVQRG